jgi:hypothetical protein
MFRLSIFQRHLSRWEVVGTYASEREARKVARSIPRVMYAIDPV